MSKRLTTGQMIEKLKVGEIAEGDSYWEVKKLVDGRIVELNTGNNITLSPTFLNEEWIIHPKYVSFSEAMKSVEEGKNAVCYFKDEKITIVSFNNKINSICTNSSCVSGGGASILIAWIVAGKWVIEEDK